ncbi:MAG: APC family permease [Bifidobacteriaceae bacterium]|nr:APC family permease [Bifidobacteriaceae bacterium]
MADLPGTLKRLVMGRPGRTVPAGQPRSVRMRYALPMLAPDALSSVAYAPDEILLTLAAAGLAGRLASPWVGVGIVAVLAVVIASYRQTVKAYPDGGGDYSVVRANFGPWAAGLVGAAMMVEALLTVAVSICSGALYLAAIVPALGDHTMVLGVALTWVVALVVLRATRVVGRVVVVAVYAFLGVLAVMLAVGVIEWAFGALPLAESAGFQAVPRAALTGGLASVAGAYLLARAFSTGAVAVTGVQTIATGVPMFREPVSRNAARSLTFLGLLCGGLLLPVLWLAREAGVRYVDNPDRDLVTATGGAIPEDYLQRPVLVQIADSVFHSWTPIVVLVSALVGGLLILAASAAFRWLPQVLSLVAHDELFPKQFYRRSDRRVAAHGIITVAAGSTALIVIMGASLTRLIQLYVVGAFLSFTLGQLGMIRHWTAARALAQTKAERRHIWWSRAINAVGLALTTITLVIVVVTKLTHGAWITLGLVAGIFAAMLAIRRHYREVDQAVAIESGQATATLPSRVHAIVLVSAMTRATARALAYARATRPSTLEALNVAIDRAGCRDLWRAWDRLNVPVTLRILDAPAREITRPLVDYIERLRLVAPHDLVVLYIPEKVVAHWWQQWLHNRSAERLTSRLRHVPGVVVTSVPWQLGYDLDAGGGPARPGPAKAGPAQRRLAGAGQPRDRAARPDRREPEA